MSGSDAGSVSDGWSLTITSEGTVEPPPLDTAAPNTTLREPPSALSSDINPRLAFRSSETGSTFQCKMDGGTFQSCTAPKRYFLLSDGEHTFQVKATDVAGNTDQTPAEHTWTVDSLDPKVTFTQRPGTATGPSRWDEWVTNDRSPAWAWTVEDLNLEPSSVRCELYDETNERYIIDSESCSSPYTFEGELPNGDYSFEVDAEDKAGNYGYAPNYFEVDTVAPKFVSGKPTGKRASTYGTVSVIFDDLVYGSKQFVNIYKKGSNTPLPLGYRDVYGKKIVIDTKKRLKSDTWYTVKVTTRVVTMTRAVDGDTIEISPTVDGKTDVRLIGIDTPEISSDCGKQPFADKAESYTARFAGQKVALEFNEERIDPYDRLLAYVYVPSGKMLNEELVAKGLAQVATFPPNTRYESKFIQAQDAASLYARGIWGLANEGSQLLEDRGNGIGGGCFAEPETSATATATAPATAPATATATAAPAPSPGVSPSAGGAPSAGGDIDCDQVDGPIPTPPGDPDGLDGDGWACE